MSGFKEQLRALKNTGSTLHGIYSLRFDLKYFNTLEKYFFFFIFNFFGIFNNTLIEFNTIGEKEVGSEFAKQLLKIV